MSTQPAQILRRAAEALRTGEIGWVKEWYVLGDGRDALGAIAYAIDPGDPDGNPFLIESAALGAASATALADYLVDELGAARAIREDRDVDVIETVGGYNDEASSVQDVIAALNAAADRIENGVAA